MRALAIAIVVLAAAGCGGGGDAGGPWLIVLREIDGTMRLAQVRAGGGEVRAVLPEVPGKVTSALVLDGGTALLVAIVPPDGPGEVWRVETRPYAATRVWSGRAPQLEAASADGRVVLLAEGRLLRLDETPPRIEELKPPKGSKWRAGDLSPDGQRLVVSFGPEGDGCPRGSTDLQCRLEVWAYDRAAPDAGWRVLARAETTAYNPLFVPGSDGAQVIYHRSLADPACPGPWACRDEEILEVGFDGTETKLLRQGAWTPRITRDGRSIAMTTVKDGRLLVGEVGGELTEITDDARFVLRWSPDGRWLAYWPETAESPTAMIRRDGTQKHVVDDGRTVGWLARPLKTGDVVPRKKTSAEHVAETIERARGLARDGEKVYAFLTVTPDGDLLKGPAPERIETHQDLREVLTQKTRALVVISRSSLCSLLGTGFDIAVLDDAEAPYLVIAPWAVEGRERDVNPHRGVIHRDPPLKVGKPIHLVEFNSLIALIGVDMPERVKRGETFEMTLYYKVIGRPGRWQTFVHFDGQGMRFQGDHEPGVCGTDGWDPGDYVTDRFEVRAGDLANPTGPYQVWTGFFSGAAPNWRNMPVSQGDASLVDANQRVLLGTITLE